MTELSEKKQKKVHNDCVPVLKEKIQGDENEHKLKQVLGDDDHKLFEFFGMVMELKVLEPLFTAAIVTFPPIMAFSSL
ncbi:unnamed protein product [Angiostrongylus costaricensis]|uniref:S ribonuclease n=1 Tax=Angiostrongylus costaricensis TaxID=334426 RepID=A0A0R3PID2_ANGCS|nr:unnamed protein product [Angiostrongylus costaricensis]VDM55695.1 unnamed protein product [Angiostrongylus costaricensis]